MGFFALALVVSVIGKSTNAVSIIGVALIIYSISLPIGLWLEEGAFDLAFGKLESPHDTDWLAMMVLTIVGAVMVLITAIMTATAAPSDWVAMAPLAAFLCGQLVYIAWAAALRSGTPFAAELPAAILVGKLRRELPGFDCHAVVAPAVGGVMVGQALARQLGVSSMILEKGTDGQFKPRQGFEREKLGQVVVADDVVNTGGTMLACSEYVTGKGGTVVAAVCLVASSDGKAKLSEGSVKLLALDVKPGARAE